MFIRVAWNPVRIEVTTLLRKSWRDAFSKNSVDEHGVSGPGCFTSERLMRFPRVCDRLFERKGILQTTMHAAARVSRASITRFRTFGETVPDNPLRSILCAVSPLFGPNLPGTPCQKVALIWRERSRSQRSSANPSNWLDSRTRIATPEGLSGVKREPPAPTGFRSGYLSRSTLGRGTCPSSRLSPGFLLVGFLRAYQHLVGRDDFGIGIAFGGPSARRGASAVPPWRRRAAKAG